MPVPQIGFDLQYLINQGTVKPGDPVSRHFPTTMSVAMAGKTATVTFVGEEGESFTIDWGDGQFTQIAKSGATHTYAAAGAYTVSLYAYFSKNWKLTQSATAVVPPDGPYNWNALVDGGGPPASGQCYTFSGVLWCHGTTKDGVTKSTGDWAILVDSNKTTITDNGTAIVTQGTLDGQSSGGLLRISGFTFPPSVAGHVYALTFYAP